MSYKQLRAKVIPNISSAYAGLIIVPWELKDSVLVATTPAFGVLLKGVFIPRQPLKTAFVL